MTSSTQHIARRAPFERLALAAGAGQAMVLGGSAVGEFAEALAAPRSSGPTNPAQRSDLTGGNDVPSHHHI